LRSQYTEFSLQSGQRDGLNLLQMKCARLEKGLGNGKLPAVAANGCCVRNDDHQRQFVISRIVAQDEAGTDFGG
jgi:hypothetical protein